ncbi:membrane-associated protein [Microbacterium sp. W4I4]|uniref:DedA family protein n=1 Tax=Microbacterium sp. W4I4 TaxID=3042295 RepID=UPI0027819041|nr:VTT domain-containing protein [Microbacterium sp. W4I4]MDQ0613121.1 membrane-associated protein [Microbacterium sp. W4I4]
MIPEPVLQILTGPWGVLLMGALVVGDAFLVVIPGEIAVTALGAIAMSQGTPPLPLIIAVAAASAWCGDVACYLIGRLVGVERWRWMRASRIRSALAWAGRRLSTGTATVLFTARFVPFARLAVNLMAGATRIRAPRYLTLAALAATGWAAYQAAIGAIVAAMLPSAPLVAVAVSVVVAVALGAVIDLVVARFSCVHAAGPND